MIIYQIGKVWTLDSLRNFLIFEIEQFQKFDYCINFPVMDILWFSKL